MFKQSFEENAVNSNIECILATENGDVDAIPDDMLIAIADGLDFQQAVERRKARKINLPSSQCFQTLAELNVFHTEKSNSIETAESSGDSALSEATLFTTATATTPPKTIVEQILSDFCSSPLTPRTALFESQVKLQPKSPAFVLQHKVIHTYSRANLANARKNLLKKIEIGNLEPMEDDCVSSTSELSVQEDLTHVESEPVEANESCVLNESERIYENLLNLSAYFSQQTETAASKQENVLNIDINEAQNQETQQIDDNVTSHNLIKVLNKQIKGHWLQVKNAARGISAAEREIINEILQLRGNKPVDLHEIRCSSYDDEDPWRGWPDAEVETQNKTALQEPQLFSDDECEDFFVNFKTQQISPATKLKTATPEKENFVGFKTASRKTIQISEEAKAKATSILEELPDFPCKNSTQQNTTEFKLKEEKLEGFKTAGCKPIVVSEAAKKKAASILAEVEETKDLVNNKNQLQKLSTSEIDIELSEWPIDDLFVSKQIKEEDDDETAFLPLLDMEQSTDSVNVRTVENTTPKNAQNISNVSNILISFKNN